MATKKKFIIVGNWKMNPDTLDEAKELFGVLSRRAEKFPAVSAIVAAPFPFISPLSMKKNSAIGIAAQDVSAEPRGAFTGSVSALQAKSAGAAYAVVGHSERRFAGDTEAIVLKKALLALDAGLKVILCVGESARDEHAEYLRFVREQVASILGKIDRKKASSLIIAYEPVWAIGKSYDLAPKPREVHEMIIYVRKTAAEILGKKDGLRIPVLYGGAVSADNAETLLRDGGVDGLFVGRQSLDPNAFEIIMSHAK